MRLYEALELLRGFFSAHGRGLDDNSLAGLEYITLERQLRVSGDRTSFRLSGTLRPEWDGLSGARTPQDITNLSVDLNVQSGVADDCSVRKLVL